MDGLQKLAIQLCACAVCCLLSSCGGNSSSGSPPSGPQPDFSLSTQPATVVIAPAGTQSAQISVSGTNGFSSSVQVTVTPSSGISVSPSAFSLSIAYSPAANDIRRFGSCCRYSNYFVYWRFRIALSQHNTANRSRFTRNQPLSALSYALPEN
jgi:hypothetical protein